MYFFKKIINIYNMRYLLSIFILLIGISASAVTFDKYYPDAEIPPSGIKISAGTFIRAMNLRDINTLVNDIGDECEFINVTDMFIGDYLVLPKNSHIYGSVEDIREPVQGNNAAIKIRIDKIVTANGDYTYFVEGHISGGADNYIGGEDTAPAYYKTTPHYIGGWGGGILQLLPMNVYAFGEHKKIKAGEEVFVILHKDLKIY
ncbi:MAG: hypothetical protein ACI37T_09580 [Candidatus Gastranaerophilaceae bacterium]